MCAHLSRFHTTCSRTAGGISCSLRAFTLARTWRSVSTRASATPVVSRSEADAVYRVMLLREVLEPTDSSSLYTRPDLPGPSSAVAVPLYNGLLPSGPVRGVR